MLQPPAVPYLLFAPEEKLTFFPQWRGNKFTCHRCFGPRTPRHTRTLRGSRLTLKAAPHLRLRRFQHTTSPTSSSSRSQQVLRTGVAFSVPLKGDELPAVLRTRESEDDTNEVLHDQAAAGQADGQRPHHARHHFSNRLLPTLPPCRCSCLCARACTRARCVRSVSPRRVASPRFAPHRPVSPRIAPPRLA